MKTSSERLKLRVLNYKDYKSFENKIFREELLYELPNATFDENANGFEGFIDIYLLLKNSKSSCPNQTKVCMGQPFALMNKTRSKSIMHISRFRNKYLKNKTDENKRKYTKQRNYCASLLRK